MKATNQKKMEWLWGNQFDPEVCAETYLEHEDEETANWSKKHESELQQMDRDTINLHRRQAENCDLRGLDHTLKKKSSGILPTQKGQLKDPSEGWLNQIFSKEAEDLHHLFSDPVLIEAVRDLTSHQKKVVYLSNIRKMKNSKIAEILGTTDRNIRDILKRTYAKLAKSLDNSRGEIYPDAAFELLMIFTLPTFLIGWKIANIIYPKLKKAVLGQAA